MGDSMIPMTMARALKIIEDCSGYWSDEHGAGIILLDGEFTADELETFAWYMRQPEYQRGDSLG